MLEKLKLGTSKGFVLQIYIDYSKENFIWVKNKIKKFLSNFCKNVKYYFVMS